MIDNRKIIYIKTKEFVIGLETVLVPHHTSNYQVQEERRHGIKYTISKSDEENTKTLEFYLP